LLLAVFFTPIAACHGECIIIKGANFSNIPEENEVSINRISVSVFQSELHTLEIVVPRDKNYNGAISVKVAGETVVSKETFTYLPKAIVSMVATIQYMGQGGIAVDVSANIYVANLFRLWTVPVTKEAYTISEGPTLYDITVDNSGNIYVTDDNNIEQVFVDRWQVIAGKTRGFSDGMGNEAQFNGNIYVADTENECIRIISPSGLVEVLSGSTTAGFVDGDGKNTKFNAPHDITIDDKGNLYVADVRNESVRKIVLEY
jgi:hypothetical protein